MGIVADLIECAIGGFLPGSGKLGGKCGKGGK